MISDKLQQQLIDAAATVRQNAYAPYSKFLVGASLLAEDGSLFCGCNVENASYGLTICAERIAIGNAISHGHKKFKAICVVADNAVSPCGACRQFIREFGSETLIMLVDSNGNQMRKKFTIDQLLPESFSL